MFINFEGLDSSGKSSQVKKLKEYLESKGEKVWLTAEPTEGPIGKLIREIQKGNLIENPSEMTMMCLYAADRAEHQKEIEEHLNNTEWVITDRYKYSSEAYQDFDDKYVRAWELNEDFYEPNITFILDISTEEAIKRIQERGKPVEIFEKKEFLEKVKDKYDYIFGSDERNIIYKINGSLPEDEVFEQIKNIIDNHL